MPIKSSYGQLPIIVFIIICVLLVQTEKHDLRILDGKPAEKYQMPYQVSLKRVGTDTAGTKHYTLFCTGAVVTLKTVITAANCVTITTRIRSFALSQPGRAGYVKINRQTLYVVGGTIEKRVAFLPADRPNMPVQWRQVKRIRVHPGFKYPIHDLALLDLDKPFREGKAIKPLPLAKTSLDYGAITAIKCQISGYGLASGKMSDKLLWAEVKVDTMSTCTKKHGSNMRNFICLASETDTQTLLKGDSGGPMVCRFPKDGNGGNGVVVGIACGSSQDATTKKWRDFYTRVGPYQKFINQGNKGRNHQVKTLPSPYLCFLVIVLQLIIIYLT